MKSIINSGWCYGLINEATDFISVKSTCLLLDVFLFDLGMLGKDEGNIIVIYWRGCKLKLVSYKPTWGVCLSTLKSKISFLCETCFFFRKRTVRFSHTFSSVLSMRAYWKRILLRCRDNIALNRRVCVCMYAKSDHKIIFR